MYKLKVTIDDETIIEIPGENLEALGLYMIGAVMEYPAEQGFKVYIEDDDKIKQLYNKKVS